MRNAPRLACADFTFPRLPHELALDFISGLGFEGVDVFLIGGNSHLPAWEVLEKPSAWARRLSSMLSDRGLELADVNFTPGGDFTTLAVNHPETGERRRSAEVFRRGIEFTAQCNGRHMTLLPGVVWPGEDRDTSLKRCAEELSWRVEEGSKAGVTVAIEAHVSSIVPAPEDARQLLEPVESLTLTLDYTHFVRQGFSESGCEFLVPHASHFHARGGRKGRLQAPMRENTIDYRRILDSLQEANYEGYVTLEYVYTEWERCNETDNVSETVILRDLLRTHASAIGSGSATPLGCAD